jgi:hypothetical protein
MRRAKDDEFCSDIRTDMHDNISVWRDVFELVLRKRAPNDQAGWRFSSCGVLSSLMLLPVGSMDASTWRCQ